MNDVRRPQQHPGERLSAELKDWAEGNQVQLHWINDTVRIVGSDSVARAVLCFPAGFWPRFSSVSAYRQEEAVAAIVSDVFCQFDAAWAGAQPKAIDVPMSYLEGAD